ncbi:MAG: segregation/condensation protein A [Candidatus Nanoarchaeia archaeon]|nr:segregation/condensation protein A [Candidatus Nanoarchaeia archaeon]
MHERIYDLLMKDDEVTWQTIIQELIKKEEMNPWDIDISKLTQKYIEVVKQMQEANFFVSGKVILAASLLLRIKSHKLVDEDIANLDHLLNPPEEEIYEEIPGIDRKGIKIPSLAMKTPQARKRKITLGDLIGALQKALVVSHRKVMKRLQDERVHMEIPERKVDITALIKNVYETVMDYLKQKETITFSELVPKRTSETVIYTLLPLLHLDFQKKINIKQNEHFEEIFITKYTEDYDGPYEVNLGI